MKYAAIVFDLFGTLVDVWSRKERHRTLVDMAEALSVSSHEFIMGWDQTAGERDIGGFASLEENILHIYASLGIAPDKHLVTKAAEIRRAFARRVLIPRPYALDTVKHLRASGHKIGLISNCSIDTPPAFRDTLLASLVDVAVFSSEVGFRKPDPRIYGSASERLSVLPQDCLYIGDGSDFELTGALRAGMQAVMIQAPYENPDDSLRDESELGWEGPRIQTLQEIVAFVD